jgi:23S rRNA (uracil1939-C5)-methyltransferase
MRSPVRVTVESIAAGGDGVAHSDGLAVFVPRTAPGDIADVHLIPKGRYARGEMVALAQPSVDRVAPLCPHYDGDQCGGCQLQHLSYDAQIEAKRRIIRDALVRLGHRSLEAPAVRASPAPWRYRTKLTLALRRSAGHWIAGLHRRDAPDDVFDLTDCWITDQRIVAAWTDIRPAMRWFPEERELRGAIRLTTDGPVFVLEGGRRWPEARRFADAVPALRAVWWVPRLGTRRLIVDRREQGAPDASFGQVNPAVARALAEHLVDRAMAHEPTTAVDAYAGAGATAVALAERGVRVTAIELDRDAAQWTQRHLPTGSRAIAERVEDAIADALPADVVILNPPRAGIDARVAAALERAHPAPRAVLYVSCNAATLARDLARMPSYRLVATLGFDMFPQTAHVETVCELVPSTA